MVFRIVDAPAAIVKVGNVVLVVPPMVFAAPVNVMLLAPPAKLPLFVQLPATERLKLFVVNVPWLMRTFPLMVSAACNVKPAGLSTVRLLIVAGSPFPVTCAEVPLYV